MAPVKVAVPAQVESQRGVVGDGAGDAAVGAAVADLQRAGGDGGRAAVGVGGGEHQRAGADLDEAAAAGEHAGERGAGAVVADA